MSHKTPILDPRNIEEAFSALIPDSTTAADDGAPKIRQIVISIDPPYPSAPREWNYVISGHKTLNDATVLQMGQAHGKSVAEFAHYLTERITLLRASSSLDRVSILVIVEDNQGGTSRNLQNCMRDAQLPGVNFYVSNARGAGFVLNHRRYKELSSLLKKVVANGDLHILEQVRGDDPDLLEDFKKALLAFNGTLPMANMRGMDQVVALGASLVVMNELVTIETQKAKEYVINK